MAAESVGNGAVDGVTNGSTPGVTNGETYVDAGAGSDRAVGGDLLRLWAPYRSAYLADGSDAGSTTGTGPHDPFLELPQRSDEDGLIVARGVHVYCVLNLFPYNPGHLMLVPYRQVADYADLTDAETLELAEFTKTALRVLRAVSHPDAVNVGMNLGKASGGSVPHHLHQHIVPRWMGDTSFMTVIAGTKVLPQVLRETRALLAREWSRHAPGDVTRPDGTVAAGDSHGAPAGASSEEPGSRTETPLVPGGHTPGDRYRSGARPSEADGSARRR